MKPLSNRLTSNPASTESKVTGGGERDRTDDILLAKQALSQLSYTPVFVVGLVGFEPTTPALSRRCSNRLSYRPQTSNLPDLFDPSQLYSNNR